MRPKKLIMKAFGSYAQETVVDFGQLNGGLYLIVGKTGAGKTTIFDAISFALFGKPSGSERDVKMLHSDFAPMSEDTVVKLDFVHQGRNYHVERSLHFARIRGTDDYRPPQPNAFMTGECMDPVDNSEKVSARCEELLGMKSDQFRRIVMLAQGEFREFMKANSEKKNDILGRLFDSSEYVRYQNLFKAVRDDLEKQTRAQQERIKTAMNEIFRLPDGEEHPEDYLPGNPHLSASLQTLVDRENEQLNALKAVSEQWNQKVGELNARSGAAKIHNALFDELDRKRARLKELGRQRDEMTAREEVCCSAEKAHRRVRAFDGEANKARNELESTEKKLAEQSDLLKRQQESVQQAEAQIEADKPLTDEKDALSARAKLLSDSLTQYAALTQKEKALRDNRAALETHQSELEKMTEQKAGLDSAIAGIGEKLDQLEGCEAEEERLKIEGKIMRDRYKAVAPEESGSLSDRVASVLRDEQSLRKDEGSLVDLANAALHTESVYHELYKGFIGGQAGVLAREMERELSENGETICPVCKTHFSRHDARCFASSSGSIPQKQEVDQAEKNWRAADRELQDRKAEIAGRRSQTEERKSGILKRMRELAYDCADWNALVAPGFLEGICEERRQDLNRIIAAYKAAHKRVEEKQALKAEADSKRGEQTALDSAITAKRTLCQELALSISGQQSAVDEIRKQLSYPSEAEAQTALNELNEKIKKLQTVTEKHQALLKNAVEIANTTAGGIRQLESSLPGKRQALQKANEELSRALTEYGFGSRENYLAALAPIGSQNAENWLISQRRVLDDYHNDVKNTAARIDELEKQTEGKSPTDLAALGRELAAAVEEQQKANAAEKEQDNRLTGHRRVQELVSDAQSALDGIEGAYSRIRRLADAAVGTSAEGGKLSFDRYVMGAIFREVLSMANQRLDIMTGGRFVLIHRMEADHKSSAAGLEMEVLDISTGKQRSAASISGGEGFMVSLALALGLSDVVQKHAGGQKLDTLFIDEGFGTLDDGKLDNVISVLQQLTEGNRLVGIISHVDKLEESIPQKLRVYGGEHGSTLRLELS